MELTSWKKVIENNVLKGKTAETELILAALLARGHVLIEDIPGVGKTTLVKYIAKSLSLQLSRIQFTSDLLPQEIIGFNRYIQQKDSFQIIYGPIFGEIILANELNRAPPTTQSALLQSMEEHEVSIDGKSYQLPDPFFVIATQNPLSQIGTFPLPESQIDRFCIKINMGLPDKANSKKLLTEPNAKNLLEQIEPVLNKEEILRCQKSVMEFPIKENLIEYINELIFSSRENSKTKALSVRASLDLLNMSKAYSFLQGRKYVIPDDIQFVFPHVVGHRLIQPTENHQVGIKLAQEIINQTPIL